MKREYEEYVYIKFGKHHGKQAKVLRSTEEDGEPASVLEVQVDEFTKDVVTKKQKNIVRVLKS